METIKNYLESMFANMPNTEAVRKAKSELFQMMEDKYNELIADGVSENAAVGTVIAEFGNLEELADDLGLATEVSEEHLERETTPRRFISFDEAKEYITAQTQFGLKIAIGVMLCIMSVIGPMAADLIKNDALGILVMFTMIAVAVGLFVYSGVTNSKWDFVKKQPCQIDMMTTSYVDEEHSKYMGTYALRLTIGIVLCAVCWLPAAVIGDKNDYLENLGGMLLFVMVGIGVFLIVYSAISKGAMEELLKVNDSTTVSGNYVKAQENVEWINDGVKLMMEIFWPVVTCIYLIWSFLTFDWHISWIIWPIAAIVHGILKASLRKK